MPYRRFLPLFLPAVLAGCSSTLVAYKETLSLAFFGAKPAVYTAQQLLNTQQEFIYVTVGDASRVSLEQVQSGTASSSNPNSSANSKSNSSVAIGVQPKTQPAAVASGLTSTWRSADRGGLVFVDHRLTRTIGLANNLSQVTGLRMQSTPVVSITSQIGELGQLLVLQQNAEFASVHMQSKITEKNQVRFSYDGYSVDAIAITEVLSSVDASLAFEAVQYYWFDANTGVLLRTIQQPALAVPVFDVVFISQLVRLTNPQGGV
jgi:hypothetical protein